MSRTVRPLRPLGKPVVSGSVWVVEGRGGRGGGGRGVNGSSRVAGLMGSVSAIALVAVVVSTGSVPVVVRTAVEPLAAGVKALSLESTPVTLENLRRETERGQRGSRPTEHGNIRKIKTL